MLLKVIIFFGDDDYANNDDGEERSEGWHEENGMYHHYTRKVMPWMYYMPKSWGFQPLCNVGMLEHMACCSLTWLVAASHGLLLLQPHMACCSLT